MDRLAAFPRAPLAVALVLVVSAVPGACDRQSTVSPEPTTPPVASVPPRPPTSAPTRPPASPDPGTVAVTRLFSLVTADGFAYQARFSGESRHTANRVPISRGLLQVNGSSVRVRATFNLDGKKVVVEHRFVDGRAWIRYGADRWARLVPFTAANSMSPFAAVHAPADLVDLGPTTIGGTTRYGVSLASAIVNPVMIPASNLTEVVITSSKLDLLVDAAGTPVSGTDTITGRGRVSGQLQEIVIDLTLTFVNVGQKVSIASP
jgi:hypothetical protein